jgi:hypothetical protein
MALLLRGKLISRLCMSLPVSTTRNTAAALLAKGADVNAEAWISVTNGRRCANAHRPAGVAKWVSSEEVVKKLKAYKPLTRVDAWGSGSGAAMSAVYGSLSTANTNLLRCSERQNAKCVRTVHGPPSFAVSILQLRSFL